MIITLNLTSFDLPIQIEGENDMENTVLHSSLDDSKALRYLRKRFHF